ncbi:hypothetical protein A6A06_24120 [Streptomyces sp. CB02923]|uniref:DUF6344 domain-containing protein n=1 Tax=Streptomyces sp. CB02923 TaxID=1718985 RepID=UPI00093AAED8|nr:DUF6344 domain-containing protein [Streptomyces sp. CB02923]OKI00237.1 hypothetical protein A6A06_24120 [Streptomyces sp. CB02923]
MATTKITQLWTAFAVVIVKFFAALGFRTSATTPATIPGPATAAAEGETHRTAAAFAAAGACAAGGGRAAAAPPGSMTDEAWNAPESPDDGHGFGCAPPAAPMFAAPRMPYGRTLPPTMKQRIRAEAHGAAPSSRCVQNDAFDAPYTGPVGAPPVRTASVPAARAVVPAARRPDLCPA